MRRKRGRSAGLGGTCHTRTADTNSITAQQIFAARCAVRDIRNVRDHYNHHPPTHDCRGRASCRNYCSRRTGWCLADAANEASFSVLLPQAGKVHIIPNAAAHVAGGCLPSRNRGVESQRRRRVHGQPRATLLKLPTCTRRRRTHTGACRGTRKHHTQHGRAAAGRHARTVAAVAHSGKWHCCSKLL